MQMLASWRQIGYLLKTRVVDAAGFLDSLQRIANGDLVLDPALMPELFNARRRAERLAVLSAREKDVLALMAEGRSNAGIAVRLRVTEATVLTHVHNIFMKLELPDAADDHRRVHAVTTYLKAR
jgi:serine/threonine-protein kinase PknK